jgi:hypothetical protein
MARMDSFEEKKNEINAALTFETGTIIDWCDEW